MTTQIMFKIDSKLKKAVQKKAKERGITLSDIFQSTARDFAKGKITIGLKTNEENWQRKSQKNLLKFYSSNDAIYDSI